MSKAFVPLTLGLPAPAAAAGFQPWCGTNHAPPAPTATATQAPETPRPPTPPKVTFQRDGDRITGIRIECGCGEVIELACEY